MSIETWLPVPGFEEFYEVSSAGRIRSLDRIVTQKNGMKRNKRGRLMKTPPSGGYPQVNLCDGAQQVNTRVHRIVAAAFLGPRPEGMEVRHLNGDPTDNAVANLAYGTSSENNYDIVKHGRSHTANRTHCPKGHPYSPENTRVYDGRRNCHTCRLTYKRAYNQRKRLERVALGAEIAGKDAK